MGPEEGSRIGCRKDSRERESFAWSCVQGLNMCLILDKIRKIAGEYTSVG